MIRKTLVLLLLAASLAAYAESPSKKLTNTIGFFTKSYNKADYDAIGKRFGGALAAAVTPAQAKNLLTTVAGRLGKIKTYKLKSLASADHATYAATCEHGSLDIEMEVDSQGKIDKLGLKPAATAAPNARP
ncbi:MAG TPA: hypothetical protein VG820_07755 [Fimbriimonadaceae bacterium]|nr:hypothetical protein [Fimbriimonadaceae bacterium]